MNGSKAISLLLALLLIVVFAWSACAPTPTATPAPTVISAPTATSRPLSTSVPTPTTAILLSTTPTPLQIAPTPTPSPTSAPKPYGTLTMAMDSLATQAFDPRLTTTADPHTNAASIYDFLVEVGPDGKLAPGLATKWEIAPDGLSWMFYLRKGVKFHNGDEFTAEDVKFSLDAFMAPDSKSTSAASLRQGISSIVVVDTYTVKVNTKGPWAVFPYIVSPVEAAEGMVLPKKYVEKVGWKEFGSKPIGTGPWKLVSFEKGVSNTYEANEAYWGQVPQFKTLKLLQIPEESTRMAMLKKGEADAAVISKSAKQAAVDSGLKIKSISDTTNHSIIFYGSALPQAGPTYDQRVRMALSLAINRDELAKYLYYDEAVPGVMLPVSPVSLGFDPNLKPHPYDIARAKQLLKDAGYENGFTITLYTSNPGGQPELIPLSQAIAGYWEKVGVKAEIVPLDHAALRAMYNAKPQPDKLIGAVSTFNVVARATTMNQLHLIFHSKDIFHVANDPEVDRLIDASFTEPDISKVDENLRKAVRILYDDARSLAIVRPNTLMALGKAVGDVQTIRGYPYLPKLLASATHAK